MPGVHGTSFVATKHLWVLFKGSLLENGEGGLLRQEPHPCCLTPTSPHRTLSPGHLL
jgi:hypothetical protein